MQSEKQIQDDFAERYENAARIERNREKLIKQRAGIKKERNAMKHLTPKKKKRK